MALYARIDAGRVAEIVPAEVGGFTLSQRFAAWFVDACRPIPAELADIVAIGWSWDGTAFAARPEPAVDPVPASISRLQLLLALAAAERITPEEALAAAQTGAVPALIDAAFAALPPPEALAARIRWATMTEAERSSPLLGAMVAAEVATDAEIDDLFRSAALL